MTALTRRPTRVALQRYRRKKSSWRKGSATANAAAVSDRAASGRLGLVHAGCEATGSQRRRQGGCQDGQIILSVFGASRGDLIEPWHAECRQIATGGLRCPGL